MKRCTQCGETKALSEFYEDKRASDERMSACKKCFLLASSKSNKRLRERRKTRRSCTDCGAPHLTDGVRCDSCQVKQNRSNRKYLQKKREWAKKEGICTACRKLPIKEGRKRCGPCLEAQLARTREYSRAMRRRALDHYGRECVCCGETEVRFLTLDHINNDGNEHRKSLGLRSGYAFYQWMEKNGYPNTLQVLCWNCNMGKYFNGGMCPHQTKGKAYIPEAPSS